MEALLDNPVIRDFLKTAGPASILAMLGWVAWWYEHKSKMEFEKRLFKLSAGQIQSNARLESALKALRELVRERLL